MKIVFLSHTASGGPFVVGSHHLSEGLARLGHAVAHVSTPVTPLHVLKGRRGGNFEVARKHGWRYRTGHLVSHQIPKSAVPLGFGLPAVRRVTARFCARSIAAHLGDTYPADVYLVDQPLFAEVLPELGAATVIYRPTDVQTERGALRGQSGLAALADGLVATNVEVAQSVPEDMRRLPTLLLPNGVDWDVYRASPSSETRQDLAVYVGAVDERFDSGYVSALARCLPKFRFDIYGPVGTAMPSNSPSNVYYRGPIAPELVPGVLRTARIGLLPLTPIARNAGRSPMKLFEYLASELHVICSGSHNGDLDESAGVYVRQSAAAAASVVNTLDPTQPNIAGSARAERESWQAKAAVLERFIAHLAGAFDARD